MKSLRTYITEASMKAEEMFLSGVMNAKLNKEQLKDMIAGLKKDGIKKLSDYLKTKYAKDYIIYEPSPDLFLKDLDKVIDNIAGFILTLSSEK